MAQAQPLPFDGSPDLSSQRPGNRRRSLPTIARASGQDVSQASASRQVDRVLAFFQVQRRCTDHEIAAGLGLALASVNALRNGLVKCGVVQAAGLQQGPFRAKRTVWQLVERAQ